MCPTASELGYSIVGARGAYELRLGETSLRVNDGGLAAANRAKSPLDWNMDFWVGQSVIVFEVVNDRTIAVLLKSSNTIVYADINTDDYFLETQPLY
jgi:hypothetical protein